ncbi:tRNA methyltransferase 10 homolog A-like [Rhopilema esculentum]|uniref:tRNA methyltransferase 10 homolog A-like n=1 Tax=Rhopilema esculentum TaxID=499914 RepID=UPI0031E255B4
MSEILEKKVDTKTSLGNYSNLNKPEAENQTEIGEFGTSQQTTDGDESTTKLSKSKLKKLRKLQKWEENKSLKRKKEKEKKRAKREAMKDAGLTVPKKRKINMDHPDASSVRVALDLSFNQLMSEKDRRKVVKQVLRSYSVNRTAAHPLQLYLTNFDDSNKELFGTFSTGYKAWDVHIVEESHLEKFSKDELVYLSSDSSNILQELNDTKVYVIGGIVDHNAHKGMCFGLAEKAGIGHARLPIDEYIKLEGRKVLPVNHVFEILLHFAEHSDWKEAFYHVIPKRKGLTSYQNSLSNASEDECGSEKSVEVNCLDSPHNAKQDETKQEDT